MFIGIMEREVYKPVRLLFVVVALCLGLASGQLDLSTPGGSSVLATFVTDPANAEVYVAGTFIGTSPATVRINADTPTPYTVRVAGGDYEVYNGTVTLGQAGVTEVYVPRVGEPLPAQTPSVPVTSAPSTGTDNADLLLRLTACADLGDSLARLTCYDRLATEYGLSGNALPSPMLPEGTTEPQVTPTPPMTTLTSSPEPLPVPTLPESAPPQPVTSAVVTSPELWESRCVAAVSDTGQSSTLAPALEAINADRSGAVQRLEEELVALDPAYTCGTYIDVDADSSTRVAKVYELSVPNLKTQAVKAALSEQLNSMNLPVRTNLIVVMRSPTGRSGAVLKTSTGLSAIDFLPLEEASTLTQLAESQRTFVLSGVSRSTPASSTRRDTYNCSDFSSQAAAQAFFRSDPGNVNRLDGDNDGRACEVLENHSFSWTPRTRLQVTQQTPAVTKPRVSSPGPSSSGGKKCYVNGYTRKNGTRVKGYYRSC